MKTTMTILLFVISISFSAIIFNSVVVNDAGQNGNIILQLDSDNNNLYFLTNVSINSYNFAYTKTVYVNSPLSMKVYDNIYVHTNDALYIFTKNLTLIRKLKIYFFDFDYDEDTQTLIVFKGNEVDLFSPDFKLLKVFNFKQYYDYFCYDSVNKKIVLAKHDGEFVVIDQILYTIKKFDYKNHDFIQISAFNGKIFFLDNNSLLSFDYLVMNKTSYKPLWLIKKNSKLFLIFNDYVLDYVKHKKYTSNFMFKDVVSIGSNIYFLYQNNFISNNYGKTYFFVSDFKNIFFNNNKLVLYDPDRGLFKENDKAYYTHIHFLTVTSDPYKHYIIGIDENNLYFLDSNYNILRVKQFSFLPVSMKIDPYNSIIYITNNENEIFSYDYSKDTSSVFSQTKKIKIFIPEFFEYYTLSKNSIEVLDSYNNVIGSFETQSMIKGAVFSDYFKALFFVTDNGLIYEYDLSSNKVIKVQKILSSADQILSLNEKIYVLDSSNQKIALISYKGS